MGMLEADGLERRFGQGLFVRTADGSDEKQVEDADLMRQS